MTRIYFCKELDVYLFKGDGFPFPPNKSFIPDVEKEERSKKLESLRKRVDHDLSLFLSLHGEQ